MQVGVMRMGVAQRRMAVPMGMRFACRPIMRVPMMYVVPMAVLVLESLVLMLMVVAFGEMQP